MSNTFHNYVQLSAVLLVRAALHSDLFYLCPCFATAFLVLSQVFSMMLDNVTNSPSTYRIALAHLQIANPYSSLNVGDYI